jgi:hypothetical protein
MKNRLPHVQTALLRSSIHSVDDSDQYSAYAHDSDVTSDGESEAGGDDDVAWSPQAGPAPPVPPDSHRLAEGLLLAGVKDVFHHLLEDEVCHASDAYSYAPYFFSGMRCVHAMPDFLVCKL